MTTSPSARQMQAKHAAANKQAILALAQRLGVRLASHDDATEAHVEEAIADGVSIAEFPTTREAAQAAHRNGLAVLMGAPNVVRGKSHSGNISAADVAASGHLDVLSSDYVPSSLLPAAFRLAETVPGMSLPEAMRMITLNPAHAAGLDDRGAIEPHRRADLVQVRLAGRHPRRAPRVARRRAGDVMDVQRTSRAGRRPQRGGQGQRAEWAPRERSRARRSVVFPAPLRHPASAMPHAEDHVSLTEMEFAIAVADDAFALWWRAHGNSYGIGRFDRGRSRAGAVVAVNCSRAGQSARHAERFANVTVVEITAPEDVLVARIVARGRETAEQALAARVAQGAGLSAGHHARAHRQRRPARARRGPASARC